MNIKKDEMMLLKMVTKSNINTSKASKYEVLKVVKIMRKIYVTLILHATKESY